MRCQEKLLPQPSWQWKLEKNKIKKNYPSMTDPIQAELNSFVGDFSFCCFTVFPSWGEVYPWRKLIMRREYKE